MKFCITLSLSSILFSQQNIASAFTTPLAPPAPLSAVVGVGGRNHHRHHSSGISPIHELQSTTEDTTSDTNIYTNDDDESSLTSKGLLKRDRYIATNRFAVRSGKGPKFEARWANRKSRLSELDVIIIVIIISIFIAIIIIIIIDIIIIVVIGLY